MFALIDTKNATHIAINIPLEGADKTIPALAGMLESNAVFIRKEWRSVATVEPEMSIRYVTGGWSSWRWRPMMG
jgi:hypothetical protein